MKKPTTWAAIIGAIFVAGNLISLSQNIANPSSLMLVNVTTWMINIAWIVFGAFLVSVFLRHDSTVATQETDAHDVAAYAKKRNWVLALLLTVSFIGSIESWVLNHYADGLTLLNLQTLFDICFNAVFLYVAVQFFRGRSPERTLLYAIIAYTVGMVAFLVLREYYFTAAANIVFGGYFIYALKATASRKTFRFAHIGLLPVLFGVLAGAGFVDSTKLMELTREQNYLDQQFGNEMRELHEAYDRLLDREVPTVTQFAEIRNAVEKREATIKAYRTNVDAVAAELLRGVTTVSGEKAIERGRYVNMSFDLHDKQGAKYIELVNFAERLNFLALTTSQRERLIEFNEEISAIDDEMTRLGYEQDKANIN